MRDIWHLNTQALIHNIQHLWKDMCAQLFVAAKVTKNFIHPGILPGISILQDILQQGIFVDLFREGSLVR